MPTFAKSVFWRGVEIQNLSSFVFQTLGIRAGKVETLNVSSFRASGFPKLGTFNVPMFGVSPRFKGFQIDVSAARGGPDANPQHKTGTVCKAQPKN